VRYLYIFREAIRISIRFRLRTLLIAASALFGVAGVIASTGYASAGRQEVIAQIRRSGTGIITITPRQSKTVAGRAKTGDIVQTLRPEDERALRIGVPEIARLSEMVTGQFLFKAGDLSKPQCPVIGCEPDYFSAKDWPVERGRIFDEHEVRSLARVVVLGHEIATSMFPDRDPIGQSATINRVPVTVIGVLSERGQGLDAADQDAQIYVPASTALNRLMNRTYLSAIVAQVSSEGEIGSAMQAIGRTMRHRHRPRAGMPVDFQVQTQQKTIETLNLSSQRLATLVRAVGFAELLYPASEYSGSVGSVSVTGHVSSEPAAHSAHGRSTFCCRL
jgi:putative ABC transport system permease protein